MWVQSFYLLLFSSIYPLLSHLWLCVSVTVSLPLFHRKKPTKRSQKVPQLCQHCHNLNRRAMPCERGGGYPRTARTPLSADQISCSCTWQSWGWGGLGGLLLKYTRITLKKKPSHAHFQEQFTYFYCQPRPSQLSLQLWVSPQRASFTADKHHKVYFSLCVRTAWANDTQEPGRVSRDTRGGFLNRGKREIWAGQMSHPPLLRALCPTTFNSLEDKK